MLRQQHGYVHLPALCRGALEAAAPASAGPPQSIVINVNRRRSGDSGYWELGMGTLLLVNHVCPVSVKDASPSWSGGRGGEDFSAEVGPRQTQREACHDAPGGMVL